MEGRKGMRPLGLVLLAAALSVGVLGCGSASADPSRGATVTRADFGDRWPFTVDQGVLRCEPPSQVVFSSGGVDYAVNGMARGDMRARGWQEIDGIWAPNTDPEVAGMDLKISVGPLIERGLELCD